MTRLQDPSIESSAFGDSSAPGAGVSLPHALRWVLLLFGTTLGFGAAAVFLWFRQGTASFDASGALEDARKQFVQDMVLQSGGEWDSFPDPEVGRLMQPNAAEPHGSNRFGLREDSYFLRRSSDSVRVVLLGDSYVFGYGVERDERVGSHLEAMLQGGLISSFARVECLHVGLTSWNLTAECAFLRRQVSLLKPDLVIHILVGNDLDDCAGVRGMGLTSSFSPQQRGRADSMVSRNYPLNFLQGKKKNWILEGVDHESRSRYAEAAERLVDLHRLVEASGGKYLAVNYWPIATSRVARELLFSELPSESVLHLTSKEFRDPRFENSERDHHWNPAGCERVARLLYAVVVGRRLLPSLTLGELAGAAELSAEMLAAGAAAAEGEPRRGWGSRVSRRIDFGELTDGTKAQIYGGIDRKGQVSPYASLILLQGQGTELHLAGGCPDRLELAGTEVKVWIEEFEVDRFFLVPGERIDRAVALPESVAGRTCLSVRFESDDYAYDPDDLRHCISFQLSEVEIR